MDERRYAGLVGDGDFFTEGYGRREVAPSAFDDMADLDRDGDLDLVKGGTEPVLRVFECVGGARYVDGGWLTSSGQKLVLPRDERNRSWVSVALHDWDGDGDPDLFASFMAGPAMNRVHYYENVTAPTGPAFAVQGPMLTASGAPVVGRVSFADWDGDGHTDVLAAWDGLVALHRNLGDAGRRLADGIFLEANGEPLQLEHARVQAADLDGDGDLDLVAGEVDGRLFWFENVGTRTGPRLTVGPADRLARLHGRVSGREGRGLRRRRAPRHPVRPCLGAARRRRRSRASSGACSATWARPRRRASRRATLRAERRTWSACSPRMRCGRTACARWTGTPTASPTCWPETATATSSSSATWALGRSPSSPRP